MNIPNEHRAIILASLEIVSKGGTDLISNDDISAAVKAQQAIDAITNADEFEQKPLTPVGKTAFIPERLQQKYKVMMFNVKLLLDQIYPRDVWPGPPDYENGDSGSVLVKQAWVAVESVEKEIKNAKG